MHHQSYFGAARPTCLGSLRDPNALHHQVLQGVVPAGGHAQIKRRRVNGITHHLILLLWVLMQLSVPPDLMKGGRCCLPLQWQSYKLLHETLYKLKKNL